MKVFRSVAELCNGCRMCEIVCSLNKTGTINRYRARIRVVASQDGVRSPLICRHCKNPPCLAVCPVPGAMHPDTSTGAVSVYEPECIGCLACVDACPFGAIQVGPDKDILKCDLCGGDPVCVKYCPPRPEHSLPHLPWAKQSCLQYIEPRMASRPR
jgi:Fe-S-cluster-containing hydrogenase component 2